jgi:tryptophanyl-tRNA synthetase
VELARELARRFNHTYGDTFPIPKLLLGDDQTLVGIDGHEKMSKSLGNAIFLSDNPETVEQKVMSMFTDPKRIRADIPGRVEGNPIFIYHDSFNPNKEEVEELKSRYRRGKVSDVEVKKRLSYALNQFMDPIRKRRAEYEDDDHLVEKILAEGSKRMREEAMTTMESVRRATGISHYSYGGGANHDHKPRKPSETTLQGLAFV